MFVLMPVSTCSRVVCVGLVFIAYPLDTFSDGNIQVSMLLNVERPQDAAEYWEPGSPLQAQLTADEVRNY